MEPLEHSQGAANLYSTFGLESIPANAQYLKPMIQPAVAGHRNGPLRSAYPATTFSFFHQLFVMAETQSSESGKPQYFLSQK